MTAPTIADFLASPYVAVIDELPALLKQGRERGKTSDLVALCTVTDPERPNNMRIAVMPRENFRVIVRECGDSLKDLGPRLLAETDHPVADGLSARVFIIDDLRDAYWAFEYTPPEMRLN